MRKRARTGYNSMGKTIFSLIGLAIAGGIFFMYTQQTYDATRALQAQVAEYDQALEKAAELQQLKQTLLSRYNSFNLADIDRLRKLLPDHVDNVRLILDMDNLAAEHGMAMQNVVISSPASEGAEGEEVVVIGGSGEEYDSVTLKFTTQGPYESFKTFLADLESSLRIVDLVSLKLSQGVDSQAIQSSIAGSSYQYEVTIRTYWLK